MGRFWTLLGLATAYALVVGTVYAPFATAYRDIKGGASEEPKRRAGRGFEPRP